MDSNTTLNPGNRLLVTWVNLTYRIKDWYHLSKLLIGPIFPIIPYFVPYFPENVPYPYFGIFLPNILVLLLQVNFQLWTPVHNCLLTISLVCVIYLNFNLLFAVINFLLCNPVSMSDTVKFDWPRGLDDGLYTER